jgi:hypothetical protein
MKTRNIPGRGLATLVGLAFLIASLSALFGEDLTNYKAWTMKHYEVLAILFGALGSGLLCRYAKRARMWIACGAFAALFVACTSLVVYKSLGRQAAASTAQAMSVEATNDLVAAKVEDLKLSRQRLQDAEKEADFERKGRPDRNGRPTKKEGCGKDCQSWERRAAEVRSHIQLLEQQLRSIGPRQVAAPEAENFSQVAGIIFGWSTDKVKALAILFVPILWTMVLEAGTIACFEYALSGKPHVTFSDNAQTSFSNEDFQRAKEMLTAPMPENEPPTGGGKPRVRKTRAVEKSSNVVFLPAKTKHEVVALLEKVGSVGSNTELAELLGCSPGEAWKRRQEVADLIEEGWHNRCRTIRLKSQRERA